MADVGAGAAEVRAAVAGGVVAGLRGRARAAARLPWHDGRGAACGALRLPRPAAVPARALRRLLRGMWLPLPQPVAVLK